MQRTCDKCTNLARVNLLSTEITPKVLISGMQNILLSVKLDVLAIAHILICIYSTYMYMYMYILEFLYGIINIYVDFMSFQRQQ